jgi:hypothetical protein
LIFVHVPPRDRAAEAATDHVDTTSHEEPDVRGAADRRQEASDREVDTIERTGAARPGHVKDHDGMADSPAAIPPSDDGWDEARRVADAVEDQHREIRDESDFNDVQQQRVADRHAVEPRPDAAETNIDDVRETATREPQRGDEDQVRVPGATSDCAPDTPGVLIRFTAGQAGLTNVCRSTEESTTRRGPRPRRSESTTTSSASEARPAEAAGW